MSLNTFGHLFRVTTWGESHGPALGCVVDGCPPGVALTRGRHPALARPRASPGSRSSPPSGRSPTRSRILSGVFEGRTTGTPISLMIENTDQRSKDYGEIAAAFRPGHADITYHPKYGMRDHRGGGRSSGARDGGAGRGRRRGAQGAGGAGAGAADPRLLVQMGADGIDRAASDCDEIERNPFWCPDAAAAARWAEYLDALRKAGNSVGAVIEVVAEGVPAGLGAPIYGKLDGDLAGAMMSINAVKGVEIGEGFAAAALTGEENADEMRMGNDGPAFLSNHAGGILGGISTGQPIVVRFAVKPTSSILTPRQTITTRRRRRPRSSPRAATTPASASAPCRWARR